jgi:hypothetical protein
MKNTPENRCKAVAAAIMHAGNELQAVGHFSRQEIAAGCLTATAELLVACHGKDVARRLLVRVADAVLDEQVSQAH